MADETDEITPKFTLNKKKGAPPLTPPLTQPISAPVENNDIKFMHLDIPDLPPPNVVVAPPRAVKSNSIAFVERVKALPDNLPKPPISIEGKKNFYENGPMEPSILQNTVMPTQNSEVASAKTQPSAQQHQQSSWDISTLLLLSAAAGAIVIGLGKRQTGKNNTQVIPPTESKRAIFEYK